MKLVEMTQDMRPWSAGNSYLVPDEIAKVLVENGQGTNVRDFPEAAVRTQEPTGKLFRKKG